MKNYKKIVSASVLFFLLMPLDFSAKPIEIESENLGKVPLQCPLHALKFSQNLKRYACIVQRLNHSYIFLNGKKKIIEQGNIEELQFSPDNKYLAYTVSTKDNTCVISDANKRHCFYNFRPGIQYNSLNQLAYIAKLGKSRFAVIDNVQGRHYDSVDYLSFSPLNNEYAYLGCKNEKCYVIRSGKESDSFFRKDLSFGLLYFGYSPDGRFLYTKPKPNGEYIVFEGKEFNKYKVLSSLVKFSLNDKRFAYLSTVAGKNYRIVVNENGKEIVSKKISESSAIDDVAFGTGGQFAYKDIEKNSKFFVINGKAQKKYWNVDELIFSPNGKSFVYKAVINPGEAVVLNGKQGKLYSSISHVIFSRENKLIYVASDKRQSFLVIGNKEGKRYNHIRQLIVLNNGSILLETKQNGKNLLVIDGLQITHSNRILNWSYDQKKNQLLFINMSNNHNMSRKVWQLDGK